MSPGIHTFDPTKKKLHKRHRSEKSEKKSKVSKKAKAKAATQVFQQYRIQCPICLNNLGEDSVCATKCGHVFCTKCLQKALLMNPVCPTCRKVIKKPKDYHPLYLSQNTPDSNINL